MSQGTVGAIRSQEIVLTPLFVQLKIGVIGPLPNQFDEIRSNINGQATLAWFDKDHTIEQSKLRVCDYIVITRHARRHHTWDAQAAIGKERAVRIPSGGIDQIVRQIQHFIGN